MIESHGKINSHGFLELRELQRAEQFVGIVDNADTQRSNSQVL